ncbi:MAG: glycosyltransferase family 2 protein [Candidatus Dadabacteria bacterium]|nr:glycosyltransferase family 2 protein [Candidatus Dadabacteria bacterium]MDE0519242.1 glycosyltransferase family 2 protein [Candidatus Dadabacteria bacterium]MDE0662654.1 glycosyltransferase family 2 protein [Candidatus Dadabacteria bacterium]
MSVGNTRVCFVIPTYNEALNITSLLRRLTQLYRDPDTVFLVVDDHSPDGTAQLVREFASETDGRVYLLEGKRQGLGNAYVRGITHAMDVLDADVVVQMDADFSHDPADARRLLGRIADGADVAIGSRYVVGGSLDERWNLRRRLLSRWGNRLARWIGGLKGVSDCTAGFKAIRTKKLRAAGLRDVRARGYVFQVELLHRLIRYGARVVEEPIHFSERERGETKLGVANMAEFLLGILRIRLRSHITFAKFCFTGLCGAVVSLVSFYLMLRFGIHKFVASPVAIMISIFSNFMMNNYWAFGDRAMIGRRSARGVKFTVVSLMTLLLSYSVFVTLSIMFPRVFPVLLQACGIAPGALLNYYLNSRWTFRGVDREG